MKYYRNGRPYRESTGSERERDAKELLNRRLGDIAAGRPLNLRADRITVGELLDDLLTEYEVNERSSLRRMKELVSQLRDALGHMRAAAVTTADVNRYIIARQAAKAANATINRELAALKRAYSLAYKATKILAKPYIPMLAENNVRTGFFEPYQLEAVRAKLPPGAAGPSYVYGDHRLAHAKRDFYPRVATGRLRRRRGPARAGHDEEPRRPGLPVYA